MCKQPPVHKAPKIDVLPKSAAKVETKAKLAASGIFNLANAPLR